VSDAPLPEGAAVSTRTRWIVAGVASLALAALVVTTTMPWLGTGVRPPSGEACAADAKQANLNFTLKNLDDVGVSLAEYAGKVILLDFWATWCLPCKVEIPMFIEFQEQYGPQGFQVIGVSVDDRLDQLVPYAAEMNINYPVLQGLGQDEMMDAFGPILGVPTTMLISRDGKICAVHPGLTAKEAFERDIKALL
jgi:cytochrome c biogenesis protein CcmG/thiol:disulfide interchange protein DsbE